MIHNISRFIAALALILLTAQTAGAQTVSNVPYIDADGNEQTATYATVVTSDMGGTSADNFSRGNGWYYVNSDVTLNGAYNTSTYTQNIILGDGATLTVSGLFRFQNASLNIYCQSSGTGRLVVSGSYGSNAIFSVTRGGTLTINGGTVEVTNTSNNGNGFNGNLVMNGGTATFTSNKGVTCYAITGSVTLNGGTFTATSGSWMGVCDKTVTIGDGKYFKDGSGNIYYGTLTDAQNNALNGVTLSPATKTEYIQACLGTGNDGSASKPYTISDAAGWDAFCLALQDNDTWNRFSGKTVQLGADITVTRMAGGSGHEFTGTFDGGGKTLTVNYANTGNNTMTAPFSYVDGATIQNLIVGGTISGTAYRAAGIIGETVNTTSHITNCVSNVDISSGRYTGGFSIGGNVEIEGCVFNGKINGTDKSGGFIGYSYSAQVIKNSLFAPQDGSSISGGTFYFNGGGDVAPVNSYYTQALGTAQGKACHSVTAGTDVTIGAIALTGDATQYTVSGITAYSGGGLQRGQTLYYGSGDQLSLTLSNTATGAPQGYQYTYTASAGTLSGTTLTMPDEDVTISVNTAALAPIDWATVNQGTDADPYMIYNKDQLLLLAHRVNGTSGETANDYGGKYFKLGADITFSHDADEGDNYAENYEAIGGYLGGYTYRHFRGNFNGDNKTVSGIRIRKTGDGDADSYQGLFGMISGGTTIHDVHLTDARIKSYYYVGGIVGYNNSCTVSGCTVTDSYITATKEPTNNYGTICGYKSPSGTLTNNYYHGCTVNGTAVTSGVGCQGADNGALPAYRLALGANITPPPGTFAGQTEWLDTPPVGARLAPENGFTLAGNHYFASGYEFTPGSTLASGAAQGYTPRATLGDVLLDLYTPTGDAPDYTGTAIARLTITADCDGKTLASTQAIYSTGQPVTVAYIKADGTPGEASAIALDGTETSLAAGWYFVGKNISYNATLALSGDVNLILADGCEMKVGESGAPIEIAYGAAIDGYVNNGEEVLTIYGQALGTGTLKAYASGDGYTAIKADALTVNGGNITAGADGEYPTAIYTQGDININRGTVTATATGTATGTESYGIYAYNGTVNINGGTVTANGTENSIFGNAVNINGGTVTANGGGIYIDCENGDVTINGGNVTASSIYSESGTITLGWTRPADRITVSSISTNYGGTVAVKDGQALTDGSGNIYTGTLSASVLSGFAAEKTLQPCLALADAADNTAAITDHAGKTLAVALSGRTLYKDGSWNTLCLPFDISTESGTLSGNNVQAMTLDTETSNLADGTLTLNFDDATGQTIPAGTPFIIKWDKSSTDITNPVFYGVTIDAEKHDATVTDVLTFTGTYAPVTIADGGDKTKLYLGSANTLYYPTKAMTIGCHRAYFQLADGITADEPVSGSNANQIRAFNLNFGDDEATGIVSVEANSSLSTLHSSLSEWYTIDGRKLAAKPTAKGLYIHGGKKVAIK